MRPLTRWIAALCLLLAGGLASSAALAHGGVRFGVWIGGPVWGPWYPPYYPYYYPPAPVVVSPPPVYIDNGSGAAAAPPPPAASTGGSYWYYCRNPQGYYPYVKECPGEWERVPAQPGK
jgi:hypothetical protein